jgi:outer membrane protein TolC
LALLVISPVVQAQDSEYSLEQCKTLALQNNAQVKNKMLDVQSAEQEKKAAFTKYFPQVEATTMAFKYNKSVFDMSIPGGDLPVYDGNPANLGLATQYAYFPGMNIPLLEKGAVGLLTATEPVFAGGRVATGNKLANLGIEVNQLQLTSTEKEVALNTEKQYWQIEALNEKRKTLERYMQMVDTLHKEVTDSYQAGLITRNDLLKVELKQNELKMNHLKLANGIEMAKMALCQYIGIDYQAGIHFADTIPQAMAPEAYYINHAEALAKRPEYQLLQKSSEAEKYKTKLRRGEYMPQVGVGVGGQYLDIDSNSSTTGMVFGTIKIPISGWWEASHKLKERRLKEEQNVNTVNDNTQKLLLQMQLVRNQLDEAYQQVQLAKTSVQQAEENLKENNDNYKAGMIRVSDMMEAQAQVQQSHDRYVDALTQYLVTKVHYLEVTGR